MTLGHCRWRGCRGDVEGEDGAMGRHHGQCLRGAPRTYGYRLVDAGRSQTPLGDLGLRGRGGLHESAHRTPFAGGLNASPLRFDPTGWESSRGDVAKSLSCCRLAVLPTRLARLYRLATRQGCLHRGQADAEASAEARSTARHEPARQSRYHVLSLDA